MLWLILKDLQGHGHVPHKMDRRSQCTNFLGFSQSVTIWDCTPSWLSILLLLPIVWFCIAQWWENSFRPSDNAAHNDNWQRENVLFSFVAFLFLQGPGIFLIQDSIVFLISFYVLIDDKGSGRLESGSDHFKLLMDEMFSLAFTAYVACYLSRIQTLYMRGPDPPKGEPNVVLFWIRQLFIVPIKEWKELESLFDLGWNGKDFLVITIITALFAVTLLVAHRLRRADLWPSPYPSFALVFTWVSLALASIWFWRLGALCLGVAVGLWLVRKLAKIS